MLLRTITYSAMLIALGVVLGGCSLGESATPTPAPNPTPSMDKDGGLRLVLAAESIDDTTSVTPAQMEEVRDVIKKRLETMGLPYAMALITSDGEVTVDVPGTVDAEELKAILIRRGFIEFVDSGSTPTSPQSFITTELGGPRVTELPPDPQARVYPVVLTGDDLLPDGASVFTDTMGALAVQLVTTDEGKKKLADYTTANIGRYMSVVLDKRVLISPLNVGAITEGTTMIGGVEEQEAKQILVYVRSGALPVYLNVVSEEAVQPR